MTETDAGTDVLGTLKDVMGQAEAGRVFGTPIQQDGVIVLPVAKIGGGGGGGGGTGSAQPGQEGAGSGGGFGISARPAGVYVLKDGRVSWRPALDVNKVILGGQLVVVVALLVARSVLRPRRPGERHGAAAAAIAAARLRDRIVKTARRQ